MIKFLESFLSWRFDSHWNKNEVFEFFVTEVKVNDMFLDWLQNVFYETTEIDDSLIFESKWSLKVFDILLGGFETFPLAVKKGFDFSEVFLIWVDEGFDAFILFSGEM